MGGGLVNGVALCLEAFVSLYYFSNFWWNRKGVELFVVHKESIEYHQINTPFKSTKQVFSFATIDAIYISDNDFETEEETQALGVELDLDRLQGNWQFGFVIDSKEQLVASERKVPAEAIRKIRDFLDSISEHATLK